jgi:hypothetical protein
MALPLFHVIKGVIDLYSVEVFRIEAKHFLGRDLFRIEFSFPFPVPIPACTDIDFYFKIPLTPTLYPKGRGISLLSPPLRRGD